MNKINIDIDSLVKVIKEEKKVVLHLEQRVNIFVQDITRKTREKCILDPVLETLMKNVNSVFQRFHDLEPSVSQSHWFEIFFQFLYTFSKLPFWNFGKVYDEIQEELEIQVRSLKHLQVENINSNKRDSANDEALNFLLLLQNYAYNKIQLFVHLHSIQRSQVSYWTWHELHFGKINRQLDKLEQDTRRLCFMLYRQNGQFRFQTPRKRVSNMQILPSRLGQEDFDLETVLLSFDEIFDKKSLSDFYTICDYLTNYIQENKSPAKFSDWILLLHYLTFKKHSAIGYWFLSLASYYDVIFPHLLFLYRTQQSSLSSEQIELIEEIIYFWKYELPPTHMDCLIRDPVIIWPEIVLNKLKRWCMNRKQTKHKGYMKSL